MHSKRRKANIALIILSIILGVWAAGIIRQSIPEAIISDTEKVVSSDIPTYDPRQKPTIDTASAPQKESPDTVIANVGPLESRRPVETRFREADISHLAAYNPFRAEAQKVMSGHLEETDSASRHRILSYCEHLRSAYPTRDIDFLRQVFSDNALIIVGHTVKTGGHGATVASSRKVSYAIRSKKEYLERLERIFNSNSRIDVEFSDFRIMRHPTAEGIYGVTLRQKYSCDRYSDDGFLFLLWDFRDPSMPLIHVRTWQPSPEILGGNEEVIEIGDFNLE